MESLGGSTPVNPTQSITSPATSTPTTKSQKVAQKIANVFSKLHNIKEFIRPGGGAVTNKISPMSVTPNTLEQEFLAPGETTTGNIFGKISEASMGVGGTQEQEHEKQVFGTIQERCSNTELKGLANPTETYEKTLQNSLQDLKQEDVVSALKQLFQGCASMAKAGIAHGHITLENCLVKTNPDGTLTCGIGGLKGSVDLAENVNNKKVDWPEVKASDYVSGKDREIYENLVGDFKSMTAPQETWQKKPGPKGLERKVDTPQGSPGQATVVRDVGRIALQRDVAALGEVLRSVANSPSLTPAQKRDCEELASRMQEENWQTRLNIGYALKALNRIFP